MEKAFQKEKLLVGQGKMAKVYQWNGFAYKCFRADYPDDWIAYEVNIQNKISELDLPTVKYYPSELPHSIKMDYLDGVSLVDRIRKEKYANGLEDLFALFLKVHENKGIDLPQLHPYLVQEISKLDLDPTYKELATRYISELPDGDVLCHLDFHFLNIIYTNNDYYIIDWITAKIGNPILDYARTYVILYEFANRFSKKYLKMVKEQCGFDELELQKAIYIMAVHRLSEYKSEKVMELVEQGYKG
jgi:predicted Ser/Thr protein kinase